MARLRMDKERAANGVLACDTPEKLFKHFQAAFSIMDSPQKILDGLERLGIAVDILSKPHPSALDLYAAQQECLLSSHDTQRAYEEMHPDSPVPSLPDGVRPEDLRHELLAMGAKTVTKCCEQFKNSAREHENISRINSLIDEKMLEKRKFINQKVEEERQSEHSISLQKQMEDIYQNKRDLSNASGKYSSMSLTEYANEYNALNNERDVLLTEINKYNEISLERIKEYAAKNFDESISALQQERDAALQRSNEADSALFEAVSSDLLSFSNVSEEQAVAWVESNVFISDAGAKHLSRIGYNQSQFKTDIAEMYRYVGGKLGPIEFIVEGKSQRAFARGKATIAIQGSFTKRTLFHELSHLVEHLDQTFYVACKNFIETRASGKAVHLKALTGINYKPTEIAYPDNFIDPYVGKIYDAESTEVVSMGLQSLSDPAALAELVKRDTEHFALVVGICKRNNPLTRKLIEQTFEATTEQINERSRLELWEKELETVCRGDFGKRLSETPMLGPERGYRGYWIDTLRGRLRRLYATHMDNGTLKLRLICMGGAKDMRSVAYLLIAHDAGVLFQELPADEASQQKIIWLIRDRKVPDWFTEKTKLPRV